MSLSNTRLLPLSPVVEREAGSVRMSFVVPPKILFCDGHFPGTPLIPGAVLAAWMREAACMAGLIGGGNRVKNLKFRAPVVPGDSVTLTAISTGPTVRVTLQSQERLCADAVFSA